MSKIAIINDNNNFFTIHFSVIVWICRWLFWTSVFFFGSYAPSEKYLGPKQSPPISHNDLKKDGAQLLLSNIDSMEQRISSVHLKFSIGWSTM